MSVYTCSMEPCAVTKRNIAFSIIAMIIDITYDCSIYAMIQRLQHISERGGDWLWKINNYNNHPCVTIITSASSVCPVT